MFLLGKWEGKMCERVLSMKLVGGECSERKKSEGRGKQ